MNNNILKNVVCFILGAGVGAAVTYYILDGKQSIPSVLEEASKDFDQTEIELMLRNLSEQKEMLKKEKAEFSREKQSIMDYSNIIHSKKYNNISEEDAEAPTETVEEMEEETIVDPEDVVDDIYDEEAIEEVIPEEPEEIEEIDPTPIWINEDEYDSDNGYDKVSLLYYTDGTLADEGDKIIRAKNKLVGSENLKRLMASETGVIFVRNNAEATDYEITMESMSYKEMTGIPPHKRG